MADEPKTDTTEPKAEENAEQEGANKEGTSKKTLIIIVAAVVLLLGLGGTTTLLLLGGDDEGVAVEKTAKSEPAANSTEDSTQDQSQNSGVSEGDPKFYPIRPAFVVNVPSKGRIRYLQIEVDVMTRSSSVRDQLETYSPLIKNELVTLFSNQDYTSLESPEGRETLRKDALARVQKVMREQAGVDGVEQVLFTRFVMQ